MIYLQLFWSFFQVGLFSFGGGYAALPLIQNQVQVIHSWLTPVEFMDILTISQMTPGPIAINASTFVGTKIAGIPGALVATLGCVTPSCIIVLSLAMLYYKYKGLSMIQGIIQGLRPAVVALIATAGLAIIMTVFFSNGALPLHPEDIEWAAIFLVVACLFLLKKLRLDPIHVMLMAGAAGFIIYGFIL